MFQDSEVSLLDKIIIYSFDKMSFVTMPRTKQTSVGAQAVTKNITMASGKVVKDLIGYRTSVKATWDYVPADTIATLIGILRNNGFCYVKYPSPNGTLEGYFEISYPTMNIFAFKNNIAVWHDVILSMNAQEVS